MFEALAAAGREEEIEAPPIPELQPENASYWRAWQHLSTERRMDGMSGAVFPIPVTAVIAYRREFYPGMTQQERRDLLEVISAMDGLFLSRMRKKLEKKPAGPPGKTRETRKPPRR